MDRNKVKKYCRRNVGNSLLKKNKAKIINIDDVILFLKNKKRLPSAFNNVNDFEDFNPQCYTVKDACELVVQYIKECL